MTQRIYWVPHTICYFGCLHCHNDSHMGGVRASRSVIDGVIAHLPSPESPYRLEEVLVGGGESLMRNNEMEYLVEGFRARFPQGPQATVEERRAAGHVILALQTIGTPLTDALGRPNPRMIQRWLDLGVDYFHIASNDMFHEAQRPDFPWDAFRENLRAFGAQHGIGFHIYGKAPSRLVPSGRALIHLESLQQAGASLLLDEGYCTNGWETASNFLSGVDKEYPHCSEVVIDPQGWVHPCCWYELSPGLFDASQVDFAAGMQALTSAPLAQALDQGDMAEMAALTGLSPELAGQIRDRVGDCGACRLYSAALAGNSQYGWLKAPALSPQERPFYGQMLGPALYEQASTPHSTPIALV